MAQMTRLDALGLKQRRRLQSLSDSDLVEQFQRNRDVDVFEVLVRRHQDTDAKADPLSSIADDDTRQQLLRVVDELPESQKTIVHLFYWHDQSINDISALLNMEANTIKSHLRRARLNLALAFQCAPRCSPSIHFNSDLRDRLQNEQRFEHQFRLRTAMLRAYWLLAALASLFILWVIPWPSQVLSGPVVASIGAFLGLVAIVPAMIYRGLVLRTAMS